MRIGIMLVCTTCHNENYLSSKNKKTQTERLEQKKFCSTCRIRVDHKEKKK